MIQELLDRIVYKDWALLYDESSNSICWTWDAPCSVKGGAPVAQYSRWWDLLGNGTMDDAAIVKTAFAAAKMAEEHECMENFKFDGIMIFNPHTSLATLRSAQREAHVP